MLSRFAFFKKFISIIPFIALVILVYFVISGREPDYTDEGLYFYEAWVSMAKHPPIQSSFPMLVNFGYLLGLPYMFLKEPGILIFRIYSMIIWLFGFGVLFYVYARRYNIVFLTPFAVALVLFSVYIPTLSYQTFPFVLFSIAGATFLATSTIDKKNLLVISGFTVSLCLMLSILAYTPSIFPASIAILIALLSCRKREFQSGFISGLIIGGIIVISIILSQKGYKPLIHAEAQKDTKDILIRGTERLVSLIKPGLIMFTLAGTIYSLLYFIEKWIKQYVQPNHKTFFRLGLSALLIIPLSVLFIKILFLFQTDISSLIKQYSYLSGFFLLAVIVLLVKNTQVKRFTLLIPVIWLGLIGLTQVFFGGSTVSYYLMYSTPGFLGIGWILLTGVSYQYHWSLIYKTFLHFIFNGLVILSITIFLLSGYRGKGATETTITLSGIFKGIRAGQERAETLQRMQYEYSKNACESRFFVAMDRLPLSYYLFHQASPFGTAWISDRLPEYADHIRSQSSACVLYRFKSKVNRGKNSNQYSKSFLEYLKLPPNRKIVNNQHLGEGIYLLVFEK